MYNNSQGKIVALAGVFQAASLVYELANTGKVDDISFKCCINSLFELNPHNITAVYGNIQNLKLGLTEIIKAQQNKTNPEVVRYALALIHLERKLMRNKQMLDIIASGITRANRQAETFNRTHENVIANLASIYTDTISNFKFRINIVGKTEILSSNTVLNQARALLLAGMRSAILWRQLGGSRLQLIFARKQIIAVAKQTLEEFC